MSDVDNMCLNFNTFFEQYISICTRDVYIKYLKLFFHMGNLETKSNFLVALSWAEILIIFCHNFSEIIKN